MHTRRTAPPKSTEPTTPAPARRPAVGAPGSDQKEPEAGADALSRKLQQRAKDPTLPTGAGERFRPETPARAPGDKSKRTPDTQARPEPRDAVTESDAPLGNRISVEIPASVLREAERAGEPLREKQRRKRMEEPVEE